MHSRVQQMQHTKGASQKCLITLTIGPCVSMCHIPCVIFSKGTAPYHVSPSFSLQLLRNSKNGSNWTEGQ